MPSDDTLYLYTSLTAGSSHIITATSRIETILKANKIPFKAVDCATDDRARMLWGRRSKGKKIPGLVKFNDVIADLEQVEDWNEHGELEDEIENVIDIFGDVPISATTAEAQAAAAQRASQTGTSISAGRTASETRHISISEPVDDRKAREAAAAAKKQGQEKDTPMSAALRQAGAEAAAKAGQKKASAAEAIKAQAQKSGDATAATVPAPVVSTGASKLETAVVDPETANTGAKTPELLAAEGATKTTSTDKADTEYSDDDVPERSTEEQVLEQRRQSTQPQKSSSLAEVTSIDDAHTVSTPENKSKSTSTPTKPKTVVEEESSDEEEEDSEEEEDKDEEDSEEEDEDEGEDGSAEEKKAPTKMPASKVGATNKQEGKVLKGQMPQKQGAKDADQAGVSVGD